MRVNVFRMNSETAGTAERIGFVFMKRVGIGCGFFIVLFIIAAIFAPTDKEEAAKTKEKPQEIFDNEIYNQILNSYEGNRNPTT